MKVNFVTLDKLNSQLSKLRIKAINKIAYLLKQMGGEVYIKNDVLEEYNIMPYISCQGNYDNSSAFSLIYKIRLDEDKVVKITFWDYEEEFRITDSNYDEILLVLEILLTIKENNLLNHSSNEDED